MAGIPTEILRVYAMADARVPERYLNDRRILRLSPAARSSLIMATVWAVSNRTDGLIERDDIPLIPTFDQSTVDALVSAGLLTVSGADAWIITDYERDQTSRAEFEVLENMRRRERTKKRRQRSKEGDSPGGHSPGTVPGDSTGKARQGQARQGRQGEEDLAVNAETAEITDWPTAVPGSGGLPESWVESDTGEWVRA